VRGWSLAIMSYEAQKMKAIKKTARMTGALYLLLAVFGPFGMLYVPSTLMAPGDAAATARNIMASDQANHHTL